jgi:hypothetical protein
MRDKEIQIEAPNNDKMITMNASALLMQMAWGDYQHVFSQLPKDWLVHSNTQDIIVCTDINEQGEYQQKYVVNMGGLMDYYQPPTAQRWGAPRPECTKEWIETRLHLIGAQEILNQVAEKEIRTAITNKWEKVKNDIHAYLDKCKSLNEALRLWPALQLYVPEEYIERVNHKVERRKREADLVETVDLEGLTATAIAAKLAGAL